MYLADRRRDGAALPLTLRVFGTQIGSLNRFDRLRRSCLTKPKSGSGRKHGSCSKLRPPPKESFHGTQKGDIAFQSEKRNQTGGKIIPKLRPADHGRHPQGRLAVPWRQVAPALARRRPPFSGSYHPPSGARPARRQEFAGRGQHRPPGSHHLPLERSGAQLEGSRAPSRFPENRGRPQRQSHLLAYPGARRRTRRLVCRHIAARPVPQRRWRRHLGRLFRPQRGPALSRLDGERTGRHPRRAQAALHHRRSARPGASVFRHVGGRRA